MFKAGDKIVRKKEYIYPYHEDYGYTGLLTVVSCSGGNVTYTLLNGKLRNGFSEDFELHQEKASGDAFNLKTTPWKILVNSPEESRMAQEWLRENGLNWPCGGGAISCLNSPILTNCEKGSLNAAAYYMHSGSNDGHDIAPEIKLTFGVTSVEYPEIPAKETEAQKKMKELEDKQREIAEELAKLRESM